MMQKKYEMSLYLLTSFTLTALAGYAYLGSFTRMLADDFCLLSSADRLGLFRSTWFWYTNWGGRYTAFGADWLVLKNILGPYRLHYLVPGTLLLWLVFTAFAIYLYLYNHRKNRTAFVHALALAGVFLFLVLRLSPDIPQSVFWWSGMRTYTLPLVLLTFLILLFLLVKDRLPVRPAVSNTAGFLLFFLSSGLSEIMAVAHTALLAYILVLHSLKYVHIARKEQAILYYGLAGTLASLVVMVLSPGNAMRQAQLPPPPDIEKLASLSVMAYGKFIAGLFQEPARVAALAGAILITLWIGSRYRDFISDGKQLIPASLFGGVMISFVCFPPGVFGFSEPPPARTLIIPAFFLTAGILTASFFAGGRLEDESGPARLPSAILLALSLVLIGFATLATAWNLYGEHQVYNAFAEKWDRVDTQILLAKAGDQDSVQIPAMDNWAHLERPTGNQEYWPTLCYTRYYGIPVYGPPYSE